MAHPVAARLVNVDGTYTYEINGVPVRTSRAAYAAVSLWRGAGPRFHRTEAAAMNARRAGAARLAVVFF